MQRLASEIRVNYKTVQRWCYEGRLPHARTRERVASLLRLHSDWLWPGETAPSWEPDLTRVYASIEQVPPGLWAYLARTTVKIDIACDDPRIVGHETANLVIERASAGANVRYCGPHWTRVHSFQERWSIDAPGAILRFDSTILVCLTAGPVLHLTDAGGELFALYRAQFEALWASANAVPSLGDWLRTPSSHS